jgi:heme-degrading monooxygenase HmoA
MRAMMTVVTEIEIKSGDEPAWDAAFRERIQDAPDQPGWIGIQLVIPLDAPNKRVVIGTWESRDYWEAWHNTDAFKRTREQLDQVQQNSGAERWYEVVALSASARR